MKHLKCESKNDKVRQENADLIRLNIENDAVRFGIFPFHFQQHFLILLSKNEYLTKLNSKGLMGLTAWEILEDILYYDDCIMLEILEIEFSSLYDHIDINATI